MNQNDNINMYEGLASYFLPEGVLKYFEVTDFATQRTLDKDVSFGNIVFGLASARPTPQGLSGAPYQVIDILMRLP